MFGSLAFLFSRRGRYPVILAGCALSLLCYVSMFLNFPMDANDHNETDDTGIIEPNTALALTTSFSLGFSDACYNTQVGGKNMPTEYLTLKVKIILTDRCHH